MRRENQGREKRKRQRWSSSSPLLLSPFSCFISLSPPFPSPSLVFLEVHLGFVIHSFPRALTEHLLCVMRRLRKLCSGSSPESGWKSLRDHVLTLQMGEAESQRSNSTHPKSLSKCPHPHSDPALLSPILFLPSGFKCWLYR